MSIRLRHLVGAALVVVLAVATSGCSSWRGLNSLPLPGVAGGGADSYTIQIELPEVASMEPNSRVRIGDVTVGNVTKIERRGWHALLTCSLSADAKLPANATAKLGQTSLLGSLHVELAPPLGESPVGRLQEGSVIPLASAGAYPTVEQTLAAVSLLLNGGGIGQLQEITQTLSAAFSGREADLHSLVIQLDTFARNLDDQSGDIITAAESLNNLAGKFAEGKPTLDRALTTLPKALAVLKDQRENLTEAVSRLGSFSEVASSALDQSKDALVSNLKSASQVFESLANAGPALTRSLSFLATYPWPNETLENWVRGDYANLTAIFDLTLSRIDQAMLTGTRFEGKLTELEMQWGRTIGQFPSPYTQGNPLSIPYRWDQGP